jgi:hypothetical protein
VNGRVPHRRAPHRRVSRLRLFSAWVAVLGIVGLVAAWQTGSARADETVDQITGNGSTDSQVTVAWAAGLLGTDNKTVVQQREDASSPSFFMQQDFQDLSVTVSQTEDLVHQSIKVSWTGGKPTRQPFLADYLQIMQCYGDARTGPTPEQCEYGSAGMLPNTSSGNGANIGTRDGNMCFSSIPSTTNPPGTSVGGGSSASAISGCDPREGTAAGAVDPTHNSPCCPKGVQYAVPFIPVDSNDRVYDTGTNLTGFFDKFSTNEMQQVGTNPDGTGEVFFSTLTGIEAPGLGCGQRRQDESVRDCWLVIVPRGEYEPNGWKVDQSSGPGGIMNESPLGASAWSDRIQIHLGFAALQPNCPIGSAKERGTIGTELVARALFSWQLALNATTNCKTLYGYANTPEATNTAQFADPTGAGLAFTTIPIGGEVSRTGGHPRALPTYVFAPVAVSALTFGFNINVNKGFVKTPIKLTPRLLAKALTQSYTSDMPTVDGPLHPPPDWAKKNLDVITSDPEFIKLNGSIARPTTSSPLAPLLTEDHSEVNQQVWAWIQSDAKARAWLSGTPDENGMVVNPAYKALNLGTSPTIDGYPRADPSKLEQDQDHGKHSVRDSLTVLPYVNDFDDAASRVRAGNNPLGAHWDSSLTDPNGQPNGWWSVGGFEPAGRVFLWAITNSADLASYGIVPADLCDGNGANCVSPNTASVTTALTKGKASKGPLPQVTPASPGSGGYPLVQITYAAVRINQDADALKDYAALLSYAANQGQTPGVAPGQLPHGYLPMPAAFRQATTKVATVLRQIANGTTPAPTAQPTQPAVGGGNGSPVAAGAAPTVAAVPPVSPAAGYSTTQASPEPVAQTTKPTPIGTVRWALISVVVVGLAGSVGSPLLRRCFGGKPTAGGNPPVGGKSPP